MPIEGQWSLYTLSRAPVMRVMRVMTLLTLNKSESFNPFHVPLRAKDKENEEEVDKNGVMINSLTELRRRDKVEAI